MCAAYRWRRGLALALLAGDDGEPGPREQALRAAVALGPLEVDDALAEERVVEVVVLREEEERDGAGG